MAIRHRKRMTASSVHPSDRLDRLEFGTQRELLDHVVETGAYECAHCRTQVEFLTRHFVLEPTPRTRGALSPFWEQSPGPPTPDRPPSSVNCSRRAICGVARAAPAQLIDSPAAERHPFCSPSSSIAAPGKEATCFSGNSCRIRQCLAPSSWGPFGGAGLVLTMIYSRRGPLIFPVYAALLAALALLIAQYSSVSYPGRFGAALAGFLVASGVAYAATMVLAGRERERMQQEGRLPGRARGVSVLGHCWRLGVLVALGVIVSAGVAFVAA